MCFTLGTQGNLWTVLKDCTLVSHFYGFMIKLYIFFVCSVSLIPEYVYICVQVKTRFGRHLRTSVSEAYTTRKKIIAIRGRKKPDAVGQLLH